MTLRVKAFPAGGSSQRIELRQDEMMPGVEEPVQVQSDSGEVRTGRIWLQQFEPARVVAVRYAAVPGNDAA